MGCHDDSYRRLTASRTAPLTLLTHDGAFWWVKGVRFNVTGVSLPSRGQYHIHHSMCLPVVRKKPWDNHTTGLTAPASTNSHSRVVIINNRGLLAMPKSSNHFIVVITDTFSKRTKGTPTAKTTATVFAAIFIDVWLSNFGIPFKVLTDIDPPLTSNFFQDICVELVVKRQTTTENCLKTDRKVKRHNATSVSRLRNYTEKHQQDWDSYALPLTYAYKALVHRQRIGPHSVSFWVDSCLVLQLQQQTQYHHMTKTMNVQ